MHHRLVRESRRPRARALLGVHWPRHHVAVVCPPFQHPPVGQGANGHAKDLTGGDSGVAGFGHVHGVPVHRRWPSLGDDDHPTAVAGRELRPRTYSSQHRVGGVPQHNKGVMLPGLLLLRPLRKVVELHAREVGQRLRTPDLAG